MKYIRIKTEKGGIKLNEHDAMLIVKEWYLNGMEPMIFMSDNIEEIDEHIDLIIWDDNYKLKPTIKIIEND